MARMKKSDYSKTTDFATKFHLSTVFREFENDVFVKNDSFREKSISQRVFAFPKKIWHFQPRQSVDGDKTDSIFGNNRVELSLVPTFVASALGPNCDDR